MKGSLSIRDYFLSKKAWESLTSPKLYLSLSGGERET